MLPFNEISKLVRLFELNNLNEIEITDGVGDKMIGIRLIKNKLCSVQQSGVSVRFGQNDVRGDTLVQTGPLVVRMVEKVITSLMVGTFCRAASLDSEPYVQLGDLIKPGQVLGIIEAMKLPNEIKAKFAGKVIAIHVENDQPVEFDQPLFTIEVEPEK